MPKVFIIVIHRKINDISNNNVTSVIISLSQSIEMNYIHLLRYKITTQKITEIAVLVK